MSNRRPNRPPKSQSAQKPRRLGPEEWVLLVAFVCLFVLGWVVVLLALPLLTHRSLPVALPPAVVEAVTSRGFVLPPTWTPAPTGIIFPTNIPTQVWDGAAPTRMYTPRPTSLPGLPVTLIPFRRGGSLTDIEVLDLARILQGESAGDKEAAYYVGWVAKNRLLHPGYGNSYAAVSSGFFGYRANMQPSQEFLDLARRIIVAGHDPTGGCLYALSRTDITKLRVPAHRADLNVNEWFFFRTWPVDYSLYASR
jgi:hypothetical protein